METVSSVSDASVIVASTQGEILYASDEGLYSKQIPQQIRAISEWPHQFKRHLWEQPVYCRSSGPGSAGQPQLIGQCRGGSGFSDTSGLSEMWRSTATIFFFAAVVVLLIAVIASSITSAHQTPPPHRDGGGRPEIRAGRVRRAGEQLQGPVRRDRGAGRGLQLHGQLPG